MTEIDTEVAVDWPDYKSTRLRFPGKPLVALPESFRDLAGPVFGDGTIEEFDDDLTKHGEGEPMGERIIVQGRLLGVDGRPIPNALIEIWQANAGGRYRHDRDQHPAPLDPNFVGGGRVVTDGEGRYRFVTIKPGAYPWGNHHNAWRPQHIHFSVFGRQFAERLVTQMYFPGDPLFEYDPIFASVRDERARELLIAKLDMEITEPEWALGYTWDIVVGPGANATPPDLD